MDRRASLQQWMDDDINAHGAAGAFFMLQPGHSIPAFGDVIYNDQSAL